MPAPGVIIRAFQSSFRRWQSIEHPAQLPEQPPFPLLRCVARYHTMAQTAMKSAPIKILLIKFINTPQNRIAMPRTMSATTQATTHWSATTPAAQPRPSSRRTEVMAATQGV